MPKRRLGGEHGCQGPVDDGMSILNYPLEIGIVPSGMETTDGVCGAWQL
jgi:hypothetical protein